MTTGKSWFAQTAPKPILVFDAEGGAEYTFNRRVRWDNPNDPPPVFDRTWDTCVLETRSLATLEKGMAWLRKGQHPFYSVVLDSLGELQKRIVDEIAGTNQMRVQDWGKLFRDGEGVVRQLRDLKHNPVRKVLCVVYVTGTIERATVTPGKELKKKDKEDDRELKLKPYAQGQLGHTLSGFADVVGMIEVQEDDTRLLRVRPRPGFVAKDRTHTFREGAIDITYDDDTGWRTTVKGMMERITETLDAREKGAAA